MSKSIYLGIDPTKSGLHLGHLYSIERTISICKSLNYRMILLIGSYTSSLGDPSDKNSPRKLLNREQYTDNAINIEKFLYNRLSKINSKIVHNHEWLNKLSFTDWVKLFGKLSMNTLMKIDFFKKRIDTSINLPLREFVYFTLQSTIFIICIKTICYGQAGGVDQRNNIIRGIKLINNKQVKGYLFPLVKDSYGKALSKTNMKDNLFSSPINTYLSIMNTKDDVLCCSSKEEKHIMAMRILNLYYDKPLRMLYSQSFNIRDIINTLHKNLLISKNQIKKLIDEKSIIINIKSNRVDIIYKKLKLYILNNPTK